MKNVENSLIKKLTNINQCLTDINQCYLILLNIQS